MSGTPKPMVLIILDGWGYSEETDYNAIAAADTPVWDRLWSDYPHTLIRTSGAAVGLPGDQMGNSEVGHLNLGAGRVVYQEFTRVSRAIKTGSFFNNKTLTGAVDLAIETGKAVHVLGLLSPGGVHSHECHIHAMVQLAVERGASKVYLHAFLDGRDTPPRSAMESIEKMEEKFREFGGGRFASLIGRYYAMDRDHRWPRIQAAYDLITQGKGEFQAPDAHSALEMAYARGESDEFVKATAIVPPGSEPVRVEDGDVVVFMNYRSDRARQITRPFIEPDFDGFERAVMPRLGRFVSLTEYNSEFDIPVAFPPERLQNVFGEYISALGLRQLRIAETEKYAHVTFFFNGGREEPFEGEERILIPSPNVATYDQQPEMSAPELTDRLVEAIEGGSYDVIVCNYANPDMVGHTGNYEAAVKAIEALDGCLGRVITALQKVGGEALITADHGNAEKMRDRETGQPHTAHTSNPVPFLYVGRPAQMASTGSLCDVAPTLLHLMGLEKPMEMTGTFLVEFPDAETAPVEVEQERRGA
ncbi:2,3-bisphosphoglycerate-independent phosphoglycerate mutase [Thiohalobacter sp. IOR34]|uniref:2,3-bisphosphoglycerate-independent phosphoglycerate mutase n=1 Tax=Thiohalobacter sp. IOR34 TaxID=3057176 RepID=UPI0025B24DC0|nr:2,3-bisphosphoglycerate-independent phosphoglycerate mutase [Thiohalobacter sp. IOR34]WJW75549.1 2,3-bisphosphoglycerate-independent phosphoglycerate mutase [Thiohalobacter sp. IOR34]